MAHHGPSSSLKNTFLTDTDIASEIFHQIKKSPLTFSTKHVKAHQDDKQPYDSLNEHARINVQCDRKASEYYHNRDLLLESNTMIPHLQAQQISLRNPFTRITTDYRAAIIQYKVGHSAEIQCSRTWKIHESALPYINWTALRQVLRSTRGRKRFAYIKAIHNQWPTMEREYKWGRSLTNICPHCAQLETTSHVFQCKNILIKANRTEALANLKRSFQQSKTHPAILNHIYRIIIQICNGFNVSDTNPSENNTEDTNMILSAFLNQKKLGYRNILFGILSKDITNEQKKYYKQQAFGKRYNAEMWSKQTIRSVLEFIINLWNFRCSKYHSDDIATPTQQIRQKAISILHLIQDDTNLIPAKYTNIRKQKTNALKKKQYTECYCMDNKS